MKKLYGWDDTGIARGELMAVMVENSAARLLGIDGAGREAGLEAAFGSYREAQKRLLQIMIQQGADPEQQLLVASLKTSDVRV